MATIPVPVAGDPTAETWAAAPVAGELNGFNVLNRTASSDAYGQAQACTAAQAGFTAITGAVVCATSITAGQYVRCATNVVSGYVWVLAEHWNGSAWVPYGARSVTLHIVVWGTGPV